MKGNIHKRRILISLIILGTVVCIIFYSFDLLYHKEYVVEYEASICEDNRIIDSCIISIDGSYTPESVITSRSARFNGSLSISCFPRTMQKNCTATVVWYNTSDKVNITYQFAGTFLPAYFKETVISRDMKNVYLVCDDGRVITNKKLPDL